MQRSTKEIGLACLLGLAAAGCGAAPSSAPSERTDVSTAYQQLVADMAACGQQIAECVREAQGDATALDACRDEREACTMAGAGPVSAIADAARACAEARRECVSGGGEPQDCAAELRTCLGARDTGGGRPDAGAQGGATGAAVRDCVAELHACVDAGTAPNECAQNIRACVAEALPSAAALGMPADPGMAGDHMPADPGQPGDPGQPADAGMPADPGMAGDHMPADPGMPGDPGQPADAGMPSDVPRAPGDLPVPDDLPEPAQAAIACLEAFQSCVTAGAPPQDCVETLRACTAERKGRP